MVSPSIERHLAKWRYKTVKGWLHRVRKFKTASINKEERVAWEKVESWMLSIKKNQYLNERGVISLGEKEED